MADLHWELFLFFSVEKCVSSKRGWNFSSIFTAAAKWNSEQSYSRDRICIELNLLKKLFLKFSFHFVRAPRHTHSRHLLVGIESLWSVEVRKNLQKSWNFINWNEEESPLEEISQFRVFVASKKNE